MTKVYDSYLRFVSLHSDLFVLRPSEDDRISYSALHRGGADDEFERRCDWRRGGAPFAPSKLTTLPVG